MYAKDLLKILEEDAPLSFSDEMVALSGGRDNSGIIIDGGGSSDKIMFSLDFSLSAVEAARDAECGLMVTHHPAIYYPLSRIAGNSQTETAVYAAIKGGLSVISMHLNLDSAREGIDANLAAVFGKVMPTALFNTPGGAAYGHIADTDGRSLAELSRKYSEETGSERVCFYGAGDCIPEKAAVFCGAGMDMEELYAAKRAGCGMAVSSDIKHYVLSEAAFLNIAVLSVTHYSAENYGFNKFYKKTEKKLQNLAEVFYHTDRELL